MDSIKSGFKYIFFLTVFLFCFQVTALMVSEVKVKGHKKISQQSILSQIQTRSGQKLLSSKVTEDIKTLYQTGYFSHISVDSYKNSRGKFIVVFKVKEKPQIRSITYKGQSHVTKDKIKEISHLKEYEFLNMTKLKTAIKDIKDHYVKKGYFLSKVTYSLKEDSKDQKVDIVILIDEGEKALIQRISFIGNKNISSERLKSFLSHKEKNIFSLFSDSGTYKKENISKDLQVIKLIYMEHGYMEAHISEPQVSFSPAKDGIYISFLIQEGEKFKVGNIDFSGDLIFSKLDLKNTLSLKRGDTFVYSNFQKDILSLQNKYGDNGYAFSNVIPRFASVDGEIHILFQIEKGKEVSINQINIVGNSKTKDKVIRREVKVHEGGTYSSSLLKESEQLIKGLGYFDDVSILSQPLQNNKVDIQVSVKERENYGEFSGGVSYRQQDEKLLSWKNVGVNSSLHQQNIFGLGQSIRATANINLVTVWINAQYIDPHIFDTDWYFSFDLFYENSEISQYLESKYLKKEDIELTDQPYSLFSGRPYISERRGFRLGLGYWFKDQWKLLPNIGLIDISMRELTQNILTGTAPQVRENFNLDQSEGFRALAGGSLEYNGKNDALFPTGGVHARFVMDYIYKFASKDKFPALNLFKFDSSFSHYVNLKRLLSDFIGMNSLLWSGYLGHVTLKNKIQIGLIHSLGSDPFVPVDLLYLLGGPTDLRGYSLLSVGTPLTDDSFSTPYGGTKQFVYNLELQIPILLRSRLYGLLFFDIGQADNSQIFKWSSLKKDVGVGVSWASPMGPVHLKLGFPLGDSQKDFIKDREFHFNIGYDF